MGWGTRGGVLTSREDYTTHPSGLSSGFSGEGRVNLARTLYEPAGEIRGRPLPPQTTQTFELAGGCSWPWERTWLAADEVEQRWLLSQVAPVALIHGEEAPAPQIVAGGGDAQCREEAGSEGVFKYAPAPSNARHRDRSTPRTWLPTHGGVLPPMPAGWVGDDGAGAGEKIRVSIDSPNVNVRQSRINRALPDVEDGDHEPG